MVAVVTTAEHLSKEEVIVVEDQKGEPVDVNENKDKVPKHRVMN